MSHEMPGTRTLDAGASPREVLMSDEGKIVRQGPNVLDSVNAFDGSNTGRTDELRAGWLMARITASGKWVPCKRTTAVGAGSSSTSLTVANAAAFQVGETLQIGSTTGIISAINYSTNVITLTASKTWSDADAVYATTLKDGSTSAAGAQTARGILNTTERLLSGVAFETTRVDKAAVILTGGYVNASLVLGDLAAIRADTAAQLTGFVWSDRQ